MSNASSMPGMRRAFVYLTCALLATAPLGAAPARASDPAPSSSSDPSLPDRAPSSRHGPIRKLGDWGQYVNPAGAAIITLSEKDSDGLKQLAKGCAITIIGTSALKRLFNFTPLGARPSGGDDSFPSGHAAAAMCAPAFLHVRYRQKRYTIPFAATGSFVAYSRVWALKHHWRDVIGSTVLSLIVANNTADRRDDESEERRRESAAALLASEQLASMNGTRLGLFELGPRFARDERDLVRTLFPTSLTLDAASSETWSAELESDEAAHVAGWLEIGPRWASDGNHQTYLGFRLRGSF